jgi:hypothetical protein
MKKVLLVLVAVVLVASGVAAVSAYEAHVINVRAHVENAMLVPSAPIEFGTVFPEEWIVKDFRVQHSTSFCWDDQWRVDSFNYSVYVEWKILSDNGTPGDTSDDTYYKWLGDALYIGIDPAVEKPEAIGGNLKWVGPDPPATQPGALWVMDCPQPIYKQKSGTQNRSDKIVVAMDVPVFEGYYNPLTDPEPKPSGLNDPTVIIAKDDPRWDPDGVDLGVDLKFQVTNIWKR